MVGRAHGEAVPDRWTKPLRGSSCPC
jgi:hypothetical protein